jgi:hypothetical protein
VVALTIDSKFFEEIKDMSIEQLAESLKDIPREMVHAVGYKAIDICNSHAKCLWLGINYHNPDNIDTARARVAAYLMIKMPSEMQAQPPGYCTNI